MDERLLDEVNEVVKRTGWTVADAIGFLTYERLYRMNQRLDDIQKTLARK